MSIKNLVSIRSGILSFYMIKQILSIRVIGVICGSKKHFEISIRQPARFESVIFPPNQNSLVP
jgi:hypothetical protein